MDKPFEYELSLIRNPIIKNIAEQGVALLPDYFYHVPASSTGKYHPDFALGDGGLYRHVRAAVAIAVDLFRVRNYTLDEQDIIITALILHDGYKQGLTGVTGYTTHSHPLTASHVLKEKIITENEEGNQALKIICDCIETHMGQWNISNRDKTILPIPETPMQLFVHDCDYLASRKDIEVKFNVRE